MKNGNVGALREAPHSEGIAMKKYFTPAEGRMKCERDCMSGLPAEFPVIENEKILLVCRECRDDAKRMEELYGFCRGRIQVVAVQ